MKLEFSHELRQAWKQVVHRPTAESWVAFFRVIFYLAVPETPNPCANGKSPIVSPDLESEVSLQDHR